MSVFAGLSILLRVLSMVVVLFHTQATSAASESCIIKQQTLIMQQLTAIDNSLAATKLYDMTMTSYLPCQLQCMSEVTCFIITFDNVAKKCSLYAKGGAQPFTAGQVYVGELKTVEYEDPSCYPCASEPCMNNGECSNIFTPDAQYTCVCPPGVTGFHCETNTSAQVALYYTTTSSSMNSVNPLSLPLVPVDTLQAYNGATTSFVCPNSGMYWFFYTVVSMADMYPAVYNVSGLNPASPSLLIQRMHTKYGGIDTVSRDAIRSCIHGNAVTVTSQYPTYADVTMGSSLGAIQLDTLMKPLIMFEVYTSLPVSNGTWFDNIMWNAGGGWSSSNQQFVAPQSGFYYFSFSFGVRASTINWFKIIDQSHNTFCDLAYYDSTHDKPDIISRGCLVSLSAGNSVMVQNSNLQNVDSTYSESSFRGFLYSPAAQSFVVCWSVHTDKTLSSPSVAIIFFDHVFANMNTAGQGMLHPYNAATATVTIPVFGLYYLEVVATSDVMKVLPIDVCLISNGIPILRLYAWLKAALVTRSRSVIVQLHADDTVHAQLSNGSVTGLNSYNSGLSFQGILLYAS